MKILYYLANHPQLSEMYVESEINYAEKQGFEVAVYSLRPPGAFYPITRKVYRGTIGEAENDFKPDFVHFHWLTIAASHVDEIKSPVTIRGHSFDYNVGRINTLIDHPKVKGIFLFPHQAKPFDSEKVIPLKVGFDSSRYFLESNKNTKQVIRCCAARPGKGLRDFVWIAKACPNFKFILCIAQIFGDTSFAKDMSDYTKSINSPAEVLIDVPPDEMSQLMRSSGIYLHTIDLPQNVGMCVSIAEGMGCGNYTIAKNTVPLSDMVLETYQTNEEAVALVNATVHWDKQKWDEVSAANVKKAQEFADYSVFPAVLDFWRSFT